MIGIYKITSPSKKIYIGQSINIEKRLLNYKGLSCKNQTIIYNSLKKHGVKKHKFEILCECEISELNDKERYYQDLYSVINRNGLNCRLTTSSDRFGKLSDETKLKISKKATGRKHSESTIEKIRISLIGNKRLLGSKLSEYQLQKLKESKNREKFVLDTQTGIFYESAKEVSDLYGFKQSTFRSKLNGNSKNNTKFIYA